jgi:2-methylcitrate synthase
MSVQEASHAPAALSNPRSRLRCRARPRATPPSAPSATAATTCTIAATTSDLAEHCEYEEVAHLLIHGKLPNAAELAAYKASLRPLRSLPAAVKQALELLPPRRIPWTCCAPASPCWAACCLSRGPQRCRRARRLPMRCWPRWVDAALLAPLCAQRRRIEWSRRATPSPRIFCICCMGAAQRGVDRGHAGLADSVCGARVQRVHVYGARDRRDGSDLYSCIAGAIGALKGPKHGGANEVALEIQQRYATADEAEADIRRRVWRARGDHRLRPSGLHHQRSAQRHCQGSGARSWPSTADDTRLFSVAERMRARDARRQAHVSQSRLVLGGRLSSDGHSHRFCLRRCL